MNILFTNYSEQASNAQLFFGFSRGIGVRRLPAEPVLKQNY